jgi:glycerol-3-phosphate dehydrogenase
MTDVDVLVVGGGINGAGIARDAAGRGLSVLLCEQDDLAQHTSSASTKLIHGGLRYLEHYDFALVRKALEEREVLLGLAPHIIWPLRFVMPHDQHLRPAWLIRCGLFLYDHLARRRRLPPSEQVDLRAHPAGSALQARFRRGFVYSDAWVDDARLVVLNAVDAAERGARVLTRTRFAEAERTSDHWQVKLLGNGPGGVDATIRVRCLVNAAGPWVGSVHDRALRSPARRHVRLVKGSHVIVPRLFEHAFAYLFQNPDRRIIFAIPYESDFTLIGTTDVEHADLDEAPRLDESERSYLCEMASRYFRTDVDPSSIVASYSGVRPLLDDESTDPASVTRDYSLELERGGAPLLSVFGGKITTYRRLAEDAMDRITECLRSGGSAWTARACLPGGDVPDGAFDTFSASLVREHPQVRADIVRRAARLYGSRAPRWLDRLGAGPAASAPASRREVIPGLYEAEVEYLWQAEFARTPDDVLWRRTKLGLRATAADRQALAAWFGSRGTRGSTPRLTAGATLGGATP